MPTSGALPPPVRPRIGPVPAALRDDLPGLLKRLETWQHELGEQPGELPVEALAELDRALSTLILALRSALDTEQGHE